MSGSRQTPQDIPAQSGFRNPPRIIGRSKGKDSLAARTERVEYLQLHAGTLLDSLAQMSFDPASVRNNIEGLVGSVEIPVGVAGPLLIKGAHANGHFYAPLATSEGALVASVARGATALTQSGGVHAAALDQRMLRVPVFEFRSLDDALTFSKWVTGKIDALRQQIRLVSRHAVLKSIEPYQFGHSVHLQFIYETGDAAGQNMTTTCTWHATTWLQAEMAQYKSFSNCYFMLEAGMSGDKKLTSQSFIRGRGTRVTAECILPSDVVRRVLKVTTEQLVRGYQKMVAGSIAAGMIGININLANVVAAIFTATGQDIACVHESSIGHLCIERAAEEAVYASVTLPGLTIGTVGGGTGLPKQRQCLELLGCLGSGNAPKFAEIIAAFCLALDLSTLSAGLTCEFADAHERLGRNRPTHAGIASSV